MPKRNQRQSQFLRLNINLYEYLLHNFESPKVKDEK
jgi:hypothetical protein